jgi:hypothetical protein
MREDRAVVTIDLWQYVPYLVIGIAVGGLLGMIFLNQRLDRIERQLNQIDWRLYEQSKPPPPTA